jgi:uncharacterized SAM-binding protein YcdF (DUF218 family)
LLSRGGQLEGALGRRVAAGRARYHRAGDGLILVTGGRTWDGLVEADAMYAALVADGVPAASIVRERCALTTRDNARLSARLVRRLGGRAVSLVTCDWHMPRARAIFEGHGMEVEPVHVPAPFAPVATRLYRSAHEWLSSRLARATTGGA